MSGSIGSNDNDEGGVSATERRPIAAFLISAGEATVTSGQVHAKARLTSEIISVAHGSTPALPYKGVAAFIARLHKRKATSVPAEELHLRPRC
jgi:hypothetical protein